MPGEGAYSDFYSPFWKGEGKEKGAERRCLQKHLHPDELRTQLSQGHVCLILHSQMCCPVTKGIRKEFQSLLLVFKKGQGGLTPNPEPHISKA